MDSPTRLTAALSGRMLKFLIVAWMSYSVRWVSVLGLCDGSNVMHCDCRRLTVAGSSSSNILSTGLRFRRYVGQNLQVSAIVEDACAKESDFYGDEVRKSMRAGEQICVDTRHVTQNKCRSRLARRLSLCQDLWRFRATHMSSTELEPHLYPGVVIPCNGYQQRTNQLQLPVSCKVILKSSLFLF